MSNDPSFFADVFGPPGHGKIESKMRFEPAKTHPLWPAKKGEFFYTLNRSKYAGILASNLSSSLKMFLTTWTRKMSQKCDLNRRKLVRFGRRKKGIFFTFNRSKYAGILASNLPSSLKMFLTTWTRKIESEMRFNIQRSPRASQSTTDREKMF